MLYSSICWHETEASRFSQRDGTRLTARRAGTFTISLNKDRPFSHARFATLTRKNRHDVPQSRAALLARAANASDVALLAGYTCQRDPLIRSMVSKQLPRLGAPLQQPMATLRSPGERLPSLLALMTASHEPTCLPCLIKPDRQDSI